MDITVRITRRTPQDYSGDLLLCFYREKERKPLPGLAGPARAAVERALAVGDFSGREDESLLVYPGAAGRGKGPARVLVIGLGREEPTPELFRKAGGTAARVTGSTKARSLFVMLPVVAGLEPGVMARGLTEGLILGSYRFRKYKSSEETEEQAGQLREILFAQASAAVRKEVRLGQITADAVRSARDMAHEPANHWTPAHFAERSRLLAERYRFGCRILGKREMEKLGMGGILAINQGSAQPPTLSILEYRTGRKVPTLLLVGKGLTFDAGGYSLKPSAGMEEMKYDMCGAAAVLAVMQAVGELAPSGLDVVAMLPATENLVGPAAVKPGDVIRMFGGKSVEVINTDAEGRLILADALAYGVEQYRPAFVIDIATLTGAVIIGLGHHRTGLLGNDEQLASRILAAGDSVGEPLWRLPLGPEYTRQLKSGIADLKNVDKRDAGTIIAAAFLQEFVGKTPWAHLDIAGTAWNYTEKPYIPKGPSGVGVRTLLELIRTWKPGS
jgi:leucyl aminopeptidase